MEIEVSGIRKDRREEAKKELQAMFREFENKLYLKIIVAKAFTTIVNRYLREKRRIDVPYDPVRSRGQAIMKTMPYISEDQLNVVLILDGKFFGEWSVEQSVFRLLNLAHECVHIKDYILLFNAKGAQAFQSEPKTTNDWMFHLANDLWNEYHAERISYQILEKLISQGKVNRNPKLFLDRLQDFREMLKEIGPFLQKLIDDFRTLAINVDDLWGEAYLRIRELLVLATYVAAKSDATKIFRMEVEDMQALPQYISFFNELWLDVHDQFKLSYRKKRTFPENELRTVAGKLRLIFLRCGLELQDVSGRMYVKVHNVAF